MSPRVSGGTLEVVSSHFKDSYPRDSRPTSEVVMTDTGSRGGVRTLHSFVDDFFPGQV